MSGTERYRIIPEVLLVPMHEGEVLLSRRANTGHDDGAYWFVGGHAEEGETMREAMCREAREEIGIEIAPDGLEHALTMHRWCGDHARIGFYFVPRSWRGEPRNMEPHKCDDLRWFPTGELPENCAAHIREAIACVLRGERYREFAWPRNVESVPLPAVGEVR